MKINKELLNRNRIHYIDSIRGFALMGILFVNLPQYFVPDPFLYMTYEGLDRFIRLVYDLFIQTKFYTIFSFLFGVSGYYFMKSAEKRVLSPRRLFARRLFWLFIFGAIHFIVFWFGDILHTYALMGLLLIVFYYRQVRTIVVWAFSLYSISLLMQSLLHFLRVDLSEGVTSTFEAYRTIDGTINFYNNIGAQMGERLDFFIAAVPSEVIVYVFEIAPLLLLGLAVAKAGVFNEPKQFMKGIVRVQWIAFSLSVPLLVMMVMEYSEGVSASYYYVYVSGKTLAVFYICTLIRISQSERWAAKLNVLAPLGRMAFTNYLSHTFVTLCVVSLFIKDTSSISLSVQFLYAIALLTVQLFVSRWILSRWQHGPLEWVWRRLTYGKRKAEPTRSEVEA